MEQRLRLLQGGQPYSRKRAVPRLPMVVPGQIVWKDGKGTTRVASVVTRDVSEHGVAVDCLGGIPIPLFRLVYLQLEREARLRPDMPEALRRPGVLAAVFRVGPCSQATGAPTDYALRLLVEPARAALSGSHAARDSHTRSA